MTSMPQTSGIPLLLLPGSLCGTEMWAFQREALADIAQIEIAGYGQRDSVVEMARAVLAEAPACFALAGFSLGGFVAFEIFRQAPERILGLALLDTTARPDSPQTRERRERNIERFHENREIVIEEFAAMVAGENTPAALRAAVLAGMRQHAALDYVPQQRAMMTRPDARPLLNAIACPVLVLCGGSDKATPPELGREIAQGVATSAYVELQGIGHMTTLEAAEPVSAAMRRWLESIGLGNPATHFNDSYHHG